MAQKSGFFNAVLSNGLYDRTYNANDYCDNLAVIISNGVLRSSADDLKVTATGMAVSVGIGRAWINGHYYSNDSVFSFSETTAPTNGSRIDCVMLRLDLSLAKRNVSLIYVQGEDGQTPVAPAPVRTADVYDLVLAEVAVGKNATSVTVTDKRADKSVCGWIYSVAGDKAFFESLDESFYEWFAEVKDTLSSVTLFKKYSWEKILTSPTKTVQFNIPQYDPETCFAEVYVNGIYDDSHTLSGTSIIFDGELIGGTAVTVNVYKSIDGTGIMSVSDEITALQNAVASIQGNSTYIYLCNGTNDNVALSQIAMAISTGSYTEADLLPTVKAFLDGLGGKAAVAALKLSQIEIEIAGELGISVPAAGDGTAANPYLWFTLSPLNSSPTIPSRTKLIFNFGKCRAFTVPCSAGTTNVIFAGTEMHLKDVNVSARGNETGTSIYMFKSGDNKGRVEAVDGHFEIYATGDARIAEHGTFTNCFCYISSDTATAYCFKPKSTGLIRLNGGEYYAYGQTSSGIGSAIIHTSAGDTDGVCIAQNIHAPVVTKANYSQGFLSVANAGATYINGCVSRLGNSGEYNQIIGLISKNKA